MVSRMQGRIFLFSLLSMFITMFIFPPMFIFPKVKYQDHIHRGASPGSLGTSNKSGWMTKESYGDYMNHFTVISRYINKNLPYIEVFKFLWEMIRKAKMT